VRFDKLGVRCGTPDGAVLAEIATSETALATNSPESHKTAVGDTI
jgi:hypothetical protein